jgi:hypothetical protein
MAQLRLTVPLNLGVDVMTNSNFAVWPALTVWEVGDPEAALIAKSGAA